MEEEKTNDHPLGVHGLLISPLSILIVVNDVLTTRPEKEEYSEKGCNLI